MKPAKTSSKKGNAALMRSDITKALS